MSQSEFEIKDKILIKYRGSEAAVVVPEGIEEIGKEAFRSCGTLTTVELPKSVKKIGEWAFFNCDELKSIKLPAGITVIESDTFAYCGELESVEIPEGVTEIGYGAFQSCYELKSIVLPKGVTEIGSYAFANCYKLERVVLPKTVKIIKDQAFKSCYKLKDIEIPEGAAYTEDAFENCPNVRLPEEPVANEEGRGLKLYIYYDKEHSGKPRIVDFYTLKVGKYIDKPVIRFIKFVTRDDGERGVLLETDEGYEAHNERVLLYPGDEYTYSFTDITITGPTDWEEDAPKNFQYLVLVKE